MPPSRNCRSSMALSGLGLATATTHESTSITHSLPTRSIAPSLFIGGARSHADAASAVRDQRQTERGSLGIFLDDTRTPRALPREQLPRASKPCLGTLDRFGHRQAAWAERTCSVRLTWVGSCHNRTHAPQQNVSLFDHLVCNLQPAELHQLRLHRFLWLVRTHADCGPVCAAALATLGSGLSNELACAPASATRSPKAIDCSVKS